MFIFVLMFGKRRCRGAPGEQFDIFVRHMFRRKCGGCFGGGFGGLFGGGLVVDSVMDSVVNIPGTLYGGLDGGRDRPLLKAGNHFILSISV